MTDYKIVFEHWRVLECKHKKRGKPDNYLMALYHRKNNRLYYPDAHGGMTVCRILKDGVEIAHGEALCSMSDNFCYKTGRELALSRAWKKLDESDTMFVANLWCYDDQDKGIPYAVRLMNSGLP